MACAVVHCGAYWCTTLPPLLLLGPPMSQRIRLTITVTPEVHEVFSRMSQASGVSLGKTMGDWLGDTIEGAQFVALKMEEARKAPISVMREVRAFARGALQEIDSAQDDFRKGLVAAGSGGVLARTAARGRQAPPSSPTGVKSPGKGKAHGGGSV